MRFFIRAIQDYFREEFEWKGHFFTALFLSVAIYLNYSFEFYEDNLRNHRYELTNVLKLFCFYLVAFVPVSFVLFKKDIFSKNIRKYLLFSIVAFLFLALDSSYYVMKFLNLTGIKSRPVRLWVDYSLSNLSSFVAVIIPLILFMLIYTPLKREKYGLQLNGAKIKPYIWLILGMIPLLFVASLNEDFLTTYPTYRDYNEYLALDIPQWVTVGIYELCYGADFISVELFFRGFMVIALSRYVGKDAILPMVIVYCFLHFGKPIGEAISSIFGGYILGILAYKTRNIYGGLIVHLGVAWGMELFAYLQSH
jgi:hypothetical protein